MKVFHFRPDDTLRVQLTIGNSQISDYRTNAVFRDPSAWYHIVVVRNNQAYVVYVNGVSQTFSLSTFGSNPASFINAATPHEIGNRLDGLNDFDGYITEFNCIDGQALAPTDFGEYDANGTWKAKKYTGTYGTNGFYLPMKPTTQAELQNTVLYTGDGTSVSVANTGYAPDFVWIKNREDTNHHRLYDTVRGSHQMLSSSQTAAEQSKGGGLTSFDSDGFSVGNDGSENNSGDNFVAWTWDAGDNQPTTGISSVVYSSAGVAQSIRGFGFNPDLVWIKRRNASNNNQLFDSVRGSQVLVTNETGAESNYSAYFKFTQNSDGFDLPAASVNMNANGGTYVAWGWDAGDGDPVTNTTGDINSTVKANDATGFSIVSYTGNGSNGATVGHGLSTTPAVVIVKDRNNTNNWAVYHKDLTSTSYSLVLNSTAAETNYGSSFIAPASSTLSLANGSQLNASSRAYIAYCFSEVSGVSKFGTYTGNGSTTGPVVTTGFRPGFVMTKRIDSTSHWMMFDTTRNPFNPVDDNLYANLSNAENNDPGLEVSDTGFQLKAAGGQVNVSSGTYIYMAFKGSYSDYVSPLNTTGTIDSRVKANQDKGFSIVSYTGNGTSNSEQTIGHGLSTAPKVVIVKNRTSGTRWHFYSTDLSSDATYAVKNLLLNSSNAESAYSSQIRGIQGSNTFSVRDVDANGNANVNKSGDNYIAYVFAEVANYSKIDSYTGTNSTGNSVTTGFRPGFVMIKNASASASWNIIDSTRSPLSTTGNGQFQDRLFPNSSSAESTNADVIEFTDTGFVINATGSSQFNNSGNTYIYMAFADTADARFNFDASGNKNNFDA